MEEKLKQLDCKLHKSYFVWTGVDPLEKSLKLFYKCNLS